MSNIYEERLGTAPMLPLIFKMALPSMAAQLVNLLYSIVDRIYIGHIPGIGTDALAGVGVTGSTILLISAFAAIVNGGGAPLAAISLGAGDRKKAQEYLGNGFVLLLIFTVVTSALAFLFMEPILLFTGASEVTLPYAVEYLSVYLLGTVFVQIATGLNAFINAQGRPGIAMGSVLIGAVLNIVLDPLFIFVFDMGVRGAALATIVAQGCSALWVMRFLCSRHATLRLQRSGMHLRWPVIRRMLSLGISPFVMGSTESVIGIVLNGTLKGFGDIYVSALAILQSAMQIASVPMSGFAQGFTPIVSYNYGHGNPQRVKHCFRIALVVMVTFTGAMALLMMLFPTVTVRMFTNDPRLVETAAEMLPYFMAGMTVFGLQRTCQNMFVSLNEAGISLFIALLRKIILLVPLALILPRFWDVTGVFAAEGIADGTAALCCIGLFLLRFPKILRRCEEGKVQ